jgi:hypothetical protein
MMARGGTAQSISDTLTSAGISGASKRTIARRMQELRGEVNADRAQRVAAAKVTPAIPLPASPDAIPEGAEPSDYDTWLADAKEQADAAQAVGDLEGFGKMGRLTVALLEAKRKATPLPKDDPNERPDMIAAKERARKELHKLIDQAVGE